MNQRIHALADVVGKLLVAVPSIGVPRDKRIPPGVSNTNAGYAPGEPDDEVIYGDRRRNQCQPPAFVTRSRRPASCWPSKPRR
jgi:hypothetical protein